MSVDTAAATIRFGLLGPVEVTVDGVVTDIGGPRQQIVLAVLTLTANRTVPVERLVTAVYGEDPPSTARVQVISVPMARPMRHEWPLATFHMDRSEEVSTRASRLAGDRRDQYPRTGSGQRPPHANELVHRTSGANTSRRP